MNAEDFKQDILYSLGGGLVDVEFECEEAGIDFDGTGSIDFAFRRAKKVYQQKGNDNWRKVFYPLQIVKGQRTYDLPEPDQVNGGGKIDTIVKIVKPTTGFNVEDPFSIAAYNDLFSAFGDSTGRAGGYNRFDYLTYELTLQQIEQSRKYGAYHEQWLHDKHKNTLEFLKAPRIGDQVWFLECYVELTDDEYRDVLWVQEYATAIAKGMLGIAYRKFSSLAAPTGEVSLDGQSLVQEANEEKAQLMEDIQNHTDGMESFVEITFG